MQDGNQVVLIGCGQLVSQAIAAGQQLAENGVSATVINNPFVNRVDIATIGEAVKRCGGKVVTIEQQNLRMGAQVSHTLTHGIEHSMISLGIENDFGQSAYMAAHLYEKHKMMASDIVEAANKLIG